MNKLKLCDSELNSCLKKLFLEKPHPLIEGNVVNCKNAVLMSISPVQIKIFTNFPNEIDKNYKTYLIDNIIRTFHILDTKLYLIFASYNITRFEIADSIHNEFGLPKKDCFDFVHGSNPSVPSIHMEKDKEMRLADWNEEFHKGIPWIAKMCRYSAIDPIFQLLVFDGIRMFFES